MKRIAFALGMLLLAGCAENSGVVKIGPNAYMVTRQAATGFTGEGTLTADAVRQANVYCAQEAKVVQVTHTQEAQPPYILGNFPRTEVDFMCVDAQTEAKRPLESEGAK